MYGLRFQLFFLNQSPWECTSETVYEGSSNDQLHLDNMLIGKVFVRYEIICNKKHLKITILCLIFP